MKTPVWLLAGTLVLGAPVAFSQTPTPPISRMSSVENNRQLAIRFVELMAQNQVEKFGEVVTDDYRQHNPLVKPGLAGIIEGGRWFHSIFPDVRVRVEQVVVEGDMVVGRFTWTGTQRGEFMGIPATGKTVSWSSMDQWRVAGGKLAEHWDVVDWAGLTQQLRAK